MAYGEIKVDTITFTDGGIDKSVTISGLVQNPTFSGNITVTGTISGNTVRGQTISGVTVTGTTAQFTSGTFTTITGGVATITSGVFASGNAAGPSVSVGTTTNGIYSPATNQIAITTSGTGRLFVDASGKVGIGISTPQSQLQVLNQIRVSDSTQSQGSLVLGDGGNTLFNVGIARWNGGTNAAGAGGIGYFSQGTGNIGGHYFYAGDTVAGSQTARMVILPGGNVGIGTTTPSALLHVAGVARIGANDTSDAELQIGMGATGNRNAYIDLIGDTTYTDYGLRLIRTNGGANGDSLLAHRGTGTLFIACEDAGNIGFRINNTERARIDSSGRLGIGTSSPLGNLHIVSSTSTAGWQVRVNGVGLSNESGFYRTASDNYEMVLRNAAGGLSYLTNTGGASSSTLEFVVQGSERARIDSSGRLGIGTSSPSTTTKMSIVDSTSAGIYLLRTAEGETVIENTGPLTIRQSSGNGANQNIFFKTGASVGTEVTAMTIDGSQRVGIGTTSPATTLDVSGNQRFSGASPVLEFNNGGPQIFLPGANTLAFATGGGIGTPTERARIDGSGRLLVGTSSSRGNWANQTGVDPLFQLERSGDMRASMTRTDANQFGPQFWFGKTRGAAYQVVSSGDELGEISFMGADGSELVSAASITAAVDATPGANDMPGRLMFSTTADGASSPTERMRIRQDGNILFGKTSLDFSVAGIQTEASSTSLTITRTSGDALTLRRNTDNGDIVSFYRDGTKVGSISVTTSATAYNTSSDYRLKENVTAVTNGITRLQQLKPSRFNFIADPGTTVDGFLAHEVQGVVPEAITGEKDAVDDEGNPQYQGIDQSKLVPLLTAALQEAIGEIESLKARLTAAGI